MTLTRLRATALVAAPVLLLVGCGSTVQTSGTADGLAQSAVATDGLAAPGAVGQEQAAGGTAAGTAGAGAAADPSGTTGGAAAVTAPGAAGSGAGSAPGAGTTSGGAPGTTAGSAPRPADGRLGPGITDKAVRVGVIYSDNADAANEAAGVKGVSVGDTKTQYQLLAQDINKRGGLGGRKLELVFHRVDGASNEDGEVLLESICAHFTQDDPVYAVVLAGSDSFRSCIRKAGAVQVHNNLSAFDDESLRLTPSFAAPTGISLTRVARGQVDQLTPPRRTSELGQHSAAVSNAVLQFRQAGVTHVQFLDSAATLALFFMPAAESQRYRPRYGLNTQDGGQALIGGGTIPAAQGKNAVGYGWLPSLDVPLSEARQSYTPAAKACLELFRSGGVNPSDGNAELVALLQCDAFSFLERTVNTGGPNLNQSLFEAAISQAEGFAPAATVASKLPAGRTDGVAAVRPFRFFEDCTCFHYTGPASAF